MNTLEISDETRSDIIWLLAKLHMYMPDDAFFGAEGAKVARLEHKYLLRDSE